MIRYTHLRDPRNQHRVLTIARELVDEEGVNVLHVGYSLNFINQNFNGSSNDVYNRKRGNAIASGRLSKDPVRIALGERKPLAAIRAFFDESNHEILDNLRVPYRAKQIALKAIEP